MGRLLIILCFVSWDVTVFAGVDLTKLIVSVNGVQHSIEPGETLGVFKGDKFLIEGAETLSGQTPKIINLVGFRKPGGNNPFDDTGKLVLVGKDLNMGWSQSGKGERYRINVRTGQKVHGQVFIRVSEPRVDFITVRINGDVKKVYPKELLSLKASDEFSLVDVSANFDVRSPNFKYRIETKETGSREIVLSRYEKNVATFPIKVY